MLKISKRLEAVKPSQTLAVTQRAAELRAQGADVISMSAGEPDFDTPRHIVEAAKQALDEGRTRYTPAAGIPELRAAVAAESAALRGVEAGAENVVVSVGAKHTLYEFFQAVLDPGDEVIVPAPYWVSYPDQVLLAGAKPVIVPTTAKSGFQLGPSALRAAITPRTRAVVINTPSNPTGGVYDKENLRRVTQAAVEADIYVLSDEIYRDLIYGEVRHVSPLALVDPERRDLVFVIDGVSKTYAMTGWRIGWGIGAPELIKAIATIQSQSTSNPNSIAQYAALAAVEGDRAFLGGWRDAYVARRDLLCRELAGIEGFSLAVPGGAFYVLADAAPVIDRMDADADDVTLSTYLLEEALVAVVPGSAFGAPGHIRLSYATSLEAIEEAIKRIRKALERL
jgi:aspartate aminotransferase